MATPQEPAVGTVTSSPGRRLAGWLKSIFHLPSDSLEKVMKKSSRIIPSVTLNI
ncbi:MAG: hypothetical protein PHQ77_07805 [Proteiniphilum sp.]|nr:hypothetical protein [Proteiniphilum sp.]